MSPTHLSGTLRTSDRSILAIETPRIFAATFRDFAASLLETKYNGARQRKAGKSQYFYFVLMLIVCHIFPSHVLPEGEEEVNHNDKEGTDHNAKDAPLLPPTPTTTTTKKQQHNHATQREARGSKEDCYKKSQRRMMRSCISLPPSHPKSQTSQSRQKTPSLSCTTQMACTTWCSV
jgi:hypothetical protein